MIIKAMPKSLVLSVTCLLVSSNLVFAQSQKTPYTEAQAASRTAFSDTLFAITPVLNDSSVLFYPIKAPITKLPENLVKDQIRCMETTIPMRYNQTIKGFINYFTVRDRKFVTSMLQRQQLYFPLYEELLKKHGLPNELKYLSIVESGLNPRAVSVAKAVGLWQFMAPTGKFYHLHQDYYIDDRMDPYKATEAACLYLKDLYRLFGDWELALAAYNCGPGNVKKAMRRSGNKKSFWQIYNFLPRETRAYVPKFIAVNYIMQYAQAYNITCESQARYIAADTIVINQYLHMGQLASSLGVSLEVLRMLNPQLKKNIIPAYVKNYSLRIPSEKKAFFALNRDSILHYASGKKLLASNAVLQNSIAFSNILTRKTIFSSVMPIDATGKKGNHYQANTTDSILLERLKDLITVPEHSPTVWAKEKNHAKIIFAKNNLPWVTKVFYSKE